jgi:dTDP-4-amino-4,6-dideoxygalactose transaminase
MIKQTDVLVPDPKGAEDVKHLYVLRSAHRDSLRGHLQTLSIASDVHYPIPDYRQPVFGERFARLRLVNTEQLIGEILTIPCYPEMTEAQVDDVIKAVNSWRT